LTKDDTYTSDFATYSSNRIAEVLNAYTKKKEIKDWYSATDDIKDNADKVSALIAEDLEFETAIGITDLTF